MPLASSGISIRTLSEEKLPSRFFRKKTPRRRDPDGPGSSKSLQKAMRILLHLSDCGPEMGLTQLAEDLRLNKTTVYRLLNAMARFEIIEKNSENERYRLGLRLHELGTRALQARSLRTEVHGFLVELARRCNESVSFAVPGAGGVVCLDRVDPPDTVITARTPIGGLFPLHCTAAAKAILAYLPETEVDAMIKRHGMRGYTSQTIRRYSAFLENLALTRHRGYADDSEEFETGLFGLAAPVFMRGSQPIGALGIAGPSPRFRREEFTRKVTLLQGCATSLSEALGRRTSEMPSPAKSSFYDPFS
jgi:DNA-binding IclR family transcriptional regulator